MVQPDEYLRDRLTSALWSEGFVDPDDGTVWVPVAKLVDTIINNLGERD